MAKINVDGNDYKVVESMGFNHNIGMYAKVVMTETGERVAVKHPRGVWRFWTPRDRVAGFAARAVGQS